MGNVKTFPLDANWQMLLQDLGVKPADVLRHAGLAEDLFSRPGAALKPSEWFALWRSLEICVDVPHFPILLAEAVTTEVFSPPIFAALASPNLSTAARRLSRYKRLIAPMRLDVVEDESGLNLTFHWLADEAPPTSLMALELAFITRLVRLATREHVVPLVASIPAMPPAASVYRDFLGIDLSQSPTLTLQFAPADAERTFLTANEAMWNIFEPELKRRLAEVARDARFEERVHSALLDSLPSGQSSMEAVAKRLAISKRTLQRRLKEEGTSFAQVLARTREKLARHYLEKTAITCSEISFLLGFEEPSSFFRAFNNWTGTTPESLRA